jgi:RHS repeat-associated protein
MYRARIRATVVAICLALLLQLPPPQVLPVAAGTVYQSPEDATPITYRPLFDTEIGSVDPCTTTQARNSGSQYTAMTRDLHAENGYFYIDGSTCHVSSGTISVPFGWSYALPGSDSFGSCGPKQPNAATTPIGAGNLRIAGVVEKVNNHGASLTVTYKNHECGPSQIGLGGTTTISVWADGAGYPHTNTFDTTLSIPAGARQIKLNFKAALNSFKIHSLRIYAAGPGQLTLLPGEQLYGGCTGYHAICPVHFEAEPVNTALGNYVSSVNDLALPGRGIGFAFQRTYNSLDTGGGVLGIGWRHAYEAHLAINPDGSRRFFAEDGAQMLFTPNGQGGFVSPPGVLSRLAPIAGGYELTRRDQIRYRFDGAGLLTAMLDRNGNQLTMTYTSGQLSLITDSVGRSVSLSYDASGRLIGLAGPPSRSVTYGYDGNGRLSSVTDARGKVTSYAYDAGGRLATIIDPNLHAVVSNEYGADGRISGQTDARGKHSTFAWDAVAQTSSYTDANGGVWLDVYAGNVLQRVVDPLGHTTRYGYDANANVTSIIDPRNYTSTFTYDAAGNMLTRKAPAPLSYQEVWTYNARNDVATYRDGRSNTTTYGYDSAGNLTSISAPLSALTQFGRDPAGTGLLLSTTDPRGKTTTYAYDAEANLTQTSSPLGNITTMTYDQAGRMLTTVDPRGNVVGGDPSQFTTTYTYDAADHLLTVTDPLSNVSTHVYDDAGNLLSLTDPNNHTVSDGYDAGNHLTSVTTAAGSTTYGYDNVANLVSRTDGNQHTTTYSYDLANELITSTDPASHSWVLTYDPAGNLATRRDANLQTTTYTYDALNRLSTVTYADPSTPAVTFGYDANSNGTSMADGAGTESYTFDALNRMTVVTRGGDTFSYGYDLVGNITSRTYPGQSAQTWAYDDDGRLASANGASYTYDPSANLLTAATPDGLTARYSYDRAGRLLEVAHTTATDTLSRFSYALDAAGNRTVMTTREGSTTYFYDALDRLTEACWSSTSCPGGPPVAPLPCLACIGGLVSRPSATTSPPPGETYRAYTYDPVGNRQTESTDAGVTTYGYDTADRLTSVTPPGQSAIAYSFDANGNQTAAGATTFSYDLADRLKTAIVGATSETYTYAGDGTRLSASTGAQASQTTKFVWDRNFGLPQVAIERDGSDTLLRDYRFGLDLLRQTAGATTYYYHHDGLGSVADVTGSTGSSLIWNEYYPYGLMRQAGTGPGAPTNPFNFTGEQLDATTGLYYLRARQYDSATGRFLTTDPRTPRTQDPYVGSYVYVKDTPTSLVDPSGRDVNGICVTGEGALVFLHLAYALCNVVSDTGQYGYVLVGGVGGGIGLGGSNGVAYLHSDAAEIYDLQGPFAIIGGSVVVVGGLQGEFFAGRGHCGQQVTGEIGGVAIGAEASAHGGASLTFVVLGEGPPKSKCDNGPAGSSDTGPSDK